MNEDVQIETLVQRALVNMTGREMLELANKTGGSDFEPFMDAITGGKVRELLALIDSAYRTSDAQTMAEILQAWIQAEDTSTAIAGQVLWASAARAGLVCTNEEKVGPLGGIDSAAVAAMARIIKDAAKVVRRRKVEDA